MLMDRKTLSIILILILLCFLAGCGPDLKDCGQIEGMKLLNDQELTLKEELSVNCYSQSLLDCEPAKIEMLPGTMQDVKAVKSSILGLEEDTGACLLRAKAGSDKITCEVPQEYLKMAWENYEPYFEGKGEQASDLKKKRLFVFTSSLYIANKEFAITNSSEDIIFQKKLDCS